MADLFDGKREITISTKYNKDYDSFSKTNLDEINFYFLAIILGRLGDRKVPTQPSKNGKKIQPSFFSPVQKDLLYGFALNLPGINLADLADESKIDEIYSTLNDYASGGMQILREKVFGNYLNEKGEIVAKPEEIVIQLNKMIYDELNSTKAPF